jgi:hypothetical protein
MDDINIYYLLLKEEQKKLFQIVADHALSINYKPKKLKTKTTTFSFINPMLKKTIVKFTVRKKEPVLAMRFCASQNYSEFFHEQIRRTIEEFDYRYTGCYGCKKCKRELEGYTYTYKDGRKYFVCGNALIELSEPSMANIDEIRNLLNAQNEFYLNRR